MILLRKEVFYDVKFFGFPLYEIAAGLFADAGVLFGVCWASYEIVGSASKIITTDEEATREHLMIVTRWMMYIGTWLWALGVIFLLISVGMQTTLWMFLPILLLGYFYATYWYFWRRRRKWLISAKSSRK